MVLKRKNDPCDPIDIKKEDIVSVLITLSLLATWYVTLLIFNYPLASLLFL